MGSTTYIITITAGATGPLVLESSGCFYFILFYFLPPIFFQSINFSICPPFLPQMFTHRFYHSLPQTITTYHYYNLGCQYLLPHQFFSPIQQFFNFTTHFTTHVTTIFTTNHYHYLHRPPTMFSVPKRNTYKCFERPAKIFIASN